MRTARFIVSVFVVGAVGLVTQRAARADEDEGKEAKAEKSWYDDIAINGLLSVATSYNFNKPESQTSQFRTFDFDDRTWKVDVAELVVQKAVADEGDIGFRFDLAVGSSIPKVTASSGLFRDEETGEAEDVDLQQAMVSFIAPAGRGLRIDFGKHVTHTGAEVIEGYDGYNQSYTHSFLFGYAIPFTHTGIKATYPWSDKVSTMLCVINGWDVAVDNNDKQTLGFQLTLTPSDKFQLYANFLSGAERADSSDLRQLADLVAIFKPTDKMTFMLNADYGTEEGLVEGDDEAVWSGVAAYARFFFGDTFSLNQRAESFDDEDGSRTGVAQTLTELTVTPEWKVKEKLIFRADIRLDRSDEDVFDDDGGASDSQATVAVNALYVY